MLGRSVRISSLAAVAGMLFLSHVWAFAADYELAPLDLGSGFSVGGTVTTDGTSGALTASNITNWNITVTQVTDIVYNRSNTANLSSRLRSDGSRLLVPTSPDGVSDGGSLWFRGGNYFGVQVADFTGTNTSGGQAYFVSGGAFDILPLNQPNNIQYVAATSHAGSASLFDLTTLDFGSGVTMFGSITTDGVSGAAHILDWNVVVRETVTWNFTNANSRVLYDGNLFSDGNHLLVRPFDDSGSAGEFAIGRYVGFDMFGVLLADFSYIAEGQAGFVTPSIYQTISPLALDSNGNRIVATAVPEPISLIAMAAAIVIFVLKKRMI